MVREDVADDRGRQTVRPYRLAFAVLAEPLLPGAAHRNLRPSLSDQAAADLARALLLDTLTGLNTLPVGSRTMFATPGEEEAEMATPLLPSRWKLSVRQGLGPVGDMKAGLSALFATDAEAAMVLRCDTPLLPLDELFEALLWLPKGRRVVLGPSRDRGLYLFGLSRVEQRFLQEIEAMDDKDPVEALNTRAESLGLEVMKLRPLYTVETLMDLRRLYDDLARRNAMSFSARLLERNDFIQIRQKLEEDGERNPSV